jgi:hypothetical protein
MPFLALIFASVCCVSAHGQLHVATGDRMFVTSANELYLQENLGNSGTVDHLTMNGTTAQSISGTGTVGSLVVNKTTGTASDKTVTITAGAGNMMGLTGVLTLTAGTLATNGNLTLKSTASGTARVATLGASASVTGNVTVERYIPAARKWRMVTTPLTGSSGNFVYDNWQNGGSVVAGTGVEVWGVGGSSSPSTGNGLQTGPNPSMRKYGSPSTGWNNVTNTKTEPLFDGTTNNAFALFVAGPFKNGASTISTSQAAEATTLSAAGALITGTHTKTLSASPAANQYFLVGNPYASPVTPSDVSGANLKNTFYMWDASTGAGVNRGLGVYVGFNRSPSPAYSVVAGSTGFSSSPMTPIQSGQAFFVQADQAGQNTTVIFEEADKTSTAGGGMFGPQQTPSEVGTLRLTLLDPTAGEALDGAVAFFYADGNAAIDRMDGYKLLNGSENVFFRRAGQSLMFEHRPLIRATDTLHVRIGNMRQAKYRLAIEPGQLNAGGLEARLIDIHARKEAKLSLGSTEGYDFAVTADSASSGDRFQIVFAKTATNGGGTAEPGDVSKRNPYPNPVVSGVPVRVDIDGAKAPWSLQLIDVAGRTVWQQAVKDPAQRRVDIDMSRMGAGVYQLLMTDGKGVQSVSRLVKQ